MFPEAREILEYNEGHCYILTIDLDYTKSDFNLDSLKEILFIDIIKESIPQDTFYNIIGNTFTYEVIKKIILKNLQFFKTDQNLILAIKFSSQTHNQ